MEQPDRPLITVQEAQACCMLDNYDYKYTLRISNTSCFTTAIMVTRTDSVLCYIRRAQVKVGLRLERRYSQR